LSAQTFDILTGELTGAPIAIAENIIAASGGNAAFSASSNGVLVYRAGAVRTSRLHWFDRSGRRLGAVGEPDMYSQFSVSPDEKQLAFQRID